MKLKTGTPLVTKTPQIFTNAVVYKVMEGKHRTVVHVLTDFGNLRVFPSIEDVLEDYIVSESYLDTIALKAEFGLGEDWLYGQFDIHDRLQRQIELLTEALGGLE